MSVRDVIKKSILESDMYNQAISMSTIITIAVDMVIALLVGILLYQIYKKFYKGVVYSKNFAISLVGMTVLTCMVTLAISTNIVISLGMVGALSIVRFRTAIKEPLDLMYLFWAITSGITIGASMYILVAISFVMMLFVVIIFNDKKGKSRSYIMIAHYENDKAGDEILRQLYKVKYMVRSKSMREDDNEMTIQITCKNNNLSFVERARGIEGVKDVMLLEFDGEYHG